jgi:pimeloyl-ACP methyl ester carboxylesterase
VLAQGMRLIEPGKAFDIAGFSYGGLMGAHLAARNPDLVRRLVIIGSGGLDTPHGHIEVTTVRGLEGEARKAAQTANLLSLMLHRRESVDALALYLQWINPRRGRVNPAPLVLPDKMLSALPLIKAHMCAIWGEFDGPHPDPEVQEAVLRRYHPDLAFRVVPGAGHWAMYEGRAVFDRLLIELLDAPLRS